MNEGLAGKSCYSLLWLSEVYAQLFFTRENPRSEEHASEGVPRPSVIQNSVWGNPMLAGWVLFSSCALRLTNLSRGVSGYWSFVKYLLSIGYMFYGNGIQQRQDAFPCTGHG